MPVNSFEEYPMSWRPTLERTQRSLYRALARQLEEDIADGRLRPGTKLPPQRELADFLDVNVSTVSKAFKLCELKGLLSATVGSGTFVSYDALSSGRLLSETPEHTVIDMGATVPEAAGNEALLSCLQDLVNGPGAARLFSYFAPSQIEWQKDAAVRLLQVCGHAAERERILFANGGQNALTAVLAALFRRGDKLAVDAHTYPGVKSAAAMLGIQLVPVAQDDQGMLPEALETVCRHESVQGIYLIPACHNPTTATMPQRRRLEIAGIVGRYGCLLIEDGTYQLMYGGMTAISDSAKEQSVYIASLSKAIAPGLRMAYLSVPPARQTAVSEALYSLNVAVVPMMAELSARIAASGQFEAIIETHRRRTEERSALVRRWLPKDVCRGGERDIFRWLLLPDRYTGAAFAQLALSRGVRVFAAEKFVVGNTPPAHAVRLSICAPKDLEQLERGVKIIAELLE